MVRSTDQSFGLEAPWFRRVERLIDSKRLADVGEVELSRKRIFILPSRAGFGFALILCIMGVTAINYKLALGYALVFLLAGLAWAAMFNTFGNLHRLVLIPGKADSVFAGELAPLTLTLKNSTRRERFSVRLYAAQFVKQALIDLPPDSERTLRFALKTERRGWLTLPRMTVDTVFPIGIWRAWARWQPAMRVLVYPEPESGNLSLPEAYTSGNASNSKGDGTDDISALRPFRDGDSQRNIAWKAVARNPGDGLLTKQFDGGSSGELRLDWNLTSAHLSSEARISRLTRWVVDAEAAGMKYALHLPTSSIQADHGPAHYKQCLTALALLEI